MNIDFAGKKAAAITLGCKVNMYDTQAMVEILKHHGCEIVGHTEFADFYIINTCTVTNFGDKKSRQMLRKVHRLNPTAIVVACGCYAQVAPEEVAAIEGVSLVLGTKDRMRIAEFISRYIENTKETDFVSSIMDEREFEELSVNKMEEHTRAYMKIQEGCDRFCTYCIIPFARGQVRSRKPENVIEEAKRLSANGFKEIVLSGIHVASYGKDLGNIGLIDLLKQVHAVDGIERIRFSSIEPLVITDGFISAILAMPKICNHFHLSLQSGCDKTLQAMNRRYTSADYEAAVNKLRSAMPDVAITTDIIVGFPGETQEDFMESCEFVKKTKLTKIHVFPYSPKTGTKAADMPGQISNHVKEERSKIMGKIGEDLQREFVKAQVGKTLTVLFEKTNENGWLEGHSTNYIHVITNADYAAQNEIMSISITGCDNFTAISKKI